MAGEKIKRPRTPQHDKLRVIMDKSQVIGDFLEWAAETKGLELVERDEEGRYSYACLRKEQLLAEFFGIDLKKLEDEKRSLLDYQRALNEVKA